MTDDDTETLGIANARETRDLVLSAALTLARRAIEHVERFKGDGVSTVRLVDEYAAGGYSWKLEAWYGAGNSFVRVDGEPQRQNANDLADIITSPEELAAVIAGDSASFRCNVPRRWVELADRAAREA